MDTPLPHRLADITFSTHNCNVEHNQIIMDLLLAPAPNWLVHPFSDAAGPWSADVSDVLGSGFQERENAGRSDTFTEIQYN